MKYNDFLESMKDEIKATLAADHKNWAVNVRRVLKNNGIELDAITISDFKVQASPTIYLNSYYDEYLKGRTIKEIAREIYDLYCENAGRFEIDLDYFRDFDKIKDNIAFKVINAQSNKKLLKNVPHIMIMDLAIVFYYIVKCSKKENATTLIYNQHMEMWNIEEAQIYEVAQENTPRLLPYEIKGMEDIIREMISDDMIYNNGISEEVVYAGEEVDRVTDKIMEAMVIPEGGNEMYVLTNTYRINGAAAMFYDGVIKKFSQIHNKNILILPSSIHEVILVPMEGNMSPQDFKEMVMEVNREEVEPSEVLSDHAYVYDKAEDKIYM